MKVWEIRQPAGIESLILAERPRPEPAHGQVRVRIRAVSLNYRDLVLLRGGYGRSVPLPIVPCSDAAGEVTAAGPGVTRVRPGDRVAGIFMQQWLAGRMTDEAARSALGGAIDGVLAEEVVLAQDGLVRIPEHLSFEEAATLPCAAVTVWHALVTEGRLAPGETVLTLGTGGVSIFALQFARMAGARVIITSKDEGKLARARDLGASDGINYVTTPEWERRVLELTGGAGVDHVVEVGGPGTLGRSLRAVRPGGRVSFIGVLASTADVDLRLIFRRSVRLQGIYVGSREMFEAMNRAIEAHGCRPVIDRTFGFDEAPDAFHHLESGTHFGKVVIAAAG